MQYKPGVARLSTIHNPTLVQGAHDLAYCMYSLVYPLHHPGAKYMWYHPASSLVCLLVSPLHCLTSSLILHVHAWHCSNVIQPVDVLSSTVSNTVYPLISSLSDYHSCSFFLLDKKKNSLHINFKTRASVVIQFYSLFKFYFPLFQTYCHT